VIVAIDGPAGSGKSAAGRRLAAVLNLPFVDSGLYYRALACAAQERGISASDPAAAIELARDTLFVVDAEVIRGGDRDYSDGVYAAPISALASHLAQIAGVRQALLAQQRRRALPAGVVMAGRDIGTVVFPEAEHKFFLVASLEERLRRRAAQLRARGESSDAERLRAEVQARDKLDTERAVAPLRAAPDAVLVDTDQMSLEEVVHYCLARIESS